MWLRQPTIIALACGLALGVALSTTTGVLANRGNAAASLLRTQSGYLREIVERVEHDYVKPVQEQQLLDNAVRGMVG